MVVVTRIAIIGGGPGGYEAALVAVELGAQVTLIDRDGLGGACVLTDCVPSKALIATSDKVGLLAAAPELGGGVDVDFVAMNRRIHELAHQQSIDIGARLLREGITVLPGSGRFASVQQGRSYRIEALDPSGAIAETVEADVVLLATGGTPRVLPGGEPDGERILSWRDVYSLTEAPAHLIVIGSGVTGAEFASGYSELGVPVTLVSSRDRVLPGEDVDAAAVIEEVFTLHGGTLVKQARAAAVRRVSGADGTGGVIVELVDGRTVAGSHALCASVHCPTPAGWDWTRWAWRSTRAAT
jgi:pyruvate/2-oxoglutarate dehydrogenase complex dihydrolipoamide dehydrogenase (E3) component